MKIKDSVVLVTGSTRGIGREIAIQFAKNGAKVLLNGRKKMPNDLKEKLDAIGADYHYLQADLANSDLKEFAQQAWSIYSKIDILVNNAGIARDKMFIAQKDEDYEQVMNLDLRVPFFLSKWLLKKMNKQRIGVIINMSSIVGLHGNLGQANYATAKAGLIGLTKSVAKEAALRGIRVNAIAPGMIDTDMTESLSDRVKKNILDQIPLAKFGSPEQVAQTAIFLAQNDYLTGQIIAVDGGMTI